MGEKVGLGYLDPLANTKAITGIDSNGLYQNSDTSLLNNQSQDLNKFNQMVDTNKLTESQKGLGGTDWFGDKDSITGMSAGQFAIGAGNLALGIADFFGQQEYNDVAMDTMKASTKLTQDQYNDFKNFKADTKQAWA